MENGFFETVEDLSGLNNLKNELINEYELGFDIETTGLDWIEDKITLIQISTRSGRVYLLDAIGLKDSEIIYLLEFIKDKKFIGHNIKFDIKFIKQKYGIMLENVHDTMVTEAFLYAGIRKPYYSLYDLVKKYADVILDKDTRDLFIGNEIIIYEMLVYAAEDVMYLFKVYDEQLKRVKKHSLEKVLELESKLVPVVASMELTGIRLDEEKWLDLEQKAQDKLEYLSGELMRIILEPIDFSQFESGNECFDTYKIPRKSGFLKDEKEKIANTIAPTEIEELFREYYNIGSTYQLQAWINRETHLDVTSTANKIIKQIKHEHEMFPLLLEWREFYKKANTYGKDFLEHIHPISGKIHATFNQMGTATGRFSSNNPNLQNIPVEKEYRACFIADEGTKLLCWDYSQMELRVAGAVTQEPVIIDAYKHGIDLHTQTASIIYEVDIDDVLPEQRQIAKSLNFAQQYGSTAHGLAYNFNMSIDDAYDLVRKYKVAMPVLDAVKTALEDKILELGYSKTPLGRKRFFVKNKKYADPRELEKHFRRLKREGFNHIIQGGSADITKLALIGLYYDNPFGDKFRLVLTVHDEIEALVDKDIVEEAEKFMQEIMENVEQPFLGEIPAKAEGKAEDYWVH